MKVNKYRAWDVEEKRWLTCDEYGEIRINPILDRFGNGFDLNDSIHEKTNRIVKFIQSIGQFDKNNKEIYEEYILKIKALEKHNAYLNDDCFIIDDIHTAVCYLQLLVHSENGESLAEIEILGNTFENPELIK